MIARNPTKTSVVLLAAAAALLAATSPALAAQQTRNAHAMAGSHAKTSDHRSHRAAEKLVIVAADVTPRLLPLKGGHVTVKASVLGATTCWATTVGGPYSVKVPTTKPKQCAGGSYEQVLTFGPNAAQSVVVVKVQLTVAGADGRIATRAFEIKEDGRHVAVPRSARAAATEVLRASATPSQLPANGGQVSVTGSVRGAVSCRLKVLTIKGFAGKGVKVTLPKPVPCSDGLYGQEATFGPNASADPATVKLALVATGGDAASAQGVFYVVVSGKSQAAATPPGALPSGAAVQIVKGIQALGHPRAAAGAVSSVAVIVHVVGKALSGPARRLAFRDMQGQLVASAPAPSACGQYTVKFSKPVPTTTLLLLGLEQHWDNGTWVPDGAQVFFDLASSPIAFTVRSTRSSGTPVVAEEGQRTC